MKLCPVVSLVSLTLAAAPSMAQDLTRKAPPQQRPIAIVHAAVHTVSGRVFPDGYVTFDHGKITGVGDAATLPRLAGGGAGFEVIDAAGKQVYPGLIGAYTQLGLTEIESVRATQDMSEVGSEGITPEVRAAVAVNPDSTLIPVTRTNGVLAAGVFPTGGTIPGRASVMVLDGWTWEDMTVADVAGLVVNWPMSRPINAWWMNTPEEEQMRNIRRGMSRVEDAFSTARAYGLARRNDPAAPHDLRWDAMLDMLPAPGESPSHAPKPVFIMAQDYDQITTAVAFCSRNHLRCVIVGGREAPLCAELLKKNDVPVVLIGTHSMPGRDDAAYDDPFTVPVQLQKAGVRWCLASGEETPHERNLPYNAARAVAFGLDMDSAIRSITLSAAEILGVADTLGSIDAGKSATLIVTDGNPLELTTRVEMAFVHGKRIDLSNKQTELNEKYREKYRQQSERSPGQ